MLDISRIFSTFTKRNADKTLQLKKLTMKDLMMLLSEAMPEDFMVDEILKELTEYKLTQSKESKEKASMLMTMFLTKECSAKIGGIDKLMDHSDKMKKGYDLLNVTES